MFRLPISGIEVELRETTGREDLLLLESLNDSLSTSIHLVGRLLRSGNGDPLNAGDLPLTDLEAVLLELRRRLIGDTVTSRGRCPQPGCAAPIDLSFSIGDYLRSHHARKPSNVAPIESQPQWFEMRGRAIQFRLVTAADLAAAAISPAPSLELARRTIHVESVAELRRSQRSVQKAMESLAPPLSGEIEGQCPGCGTRVSFWFDVPTYVHKELRFDAELVYEDVHQLAMHYHWSEQEILDLPRQRRMHYVELALQQGGY
jgi:hypothetical protein